LSDVAASGEKVIESASNAPESSGEKVIESASNAPESSGEKVIESNAPEASAQKVIESNAPESSGDKVIESASNAPESSGEKVIESASNAPESSGEKVIESNAPEASGEKAIESNAPESSGDKVIESASNAPESSGEKANEIITKTATVFGRKFTMTVFHSKDKRHDGVKDGNETKGDDKEKEKEKSHSYRINIKNPFAKSESSKVKEVSSSADPILEEKVIDSGKVDETVKHADSENIDETVKHADSEKFDGAVIVEQAVHSEKVDKSEKDVKMNRRSFNIKNLFTKYSETQKVKEVASVMDPIDDQKVIDKNDGSQNVDGNAVIVELETVKHGDSEKIDETVVEQAAHSEKVDETVVEQAAHSEKVDETVVEQAAHSEKVDETVVEQAAHSEKVDKSEKDVKMTLARDTMTLGRATMKMFSKYVPSSSKDASEIKVDSEVKPAETAGCEKLAADSGKVDETGKQADSEKINETVVEQAAHSEKIDKSEKDVKMTLGRATMTLGRATMKMFSKSVPSSSKDVSEIKVDSEVKPAETAGCEKDEIPFFKSKKHSFFNSGFTLKMPEIPKAKSLDEARIDRIAEVQEVNEEVESTKPAEKPNKRHAIFRGRSFFNNASKETLTDSEQTVEKKTIFEKINEKVTVISETLRRKHGKNVVVPETEGIFLIY
jgi:hypothetical protein